MDKKDLKRKYKQTRQPIGVFQIRNTGSEKIFIGSTMNLNGIFNRHKFQLKAGVHPNKILHADWNELGAENFVFEILEEVFPRENPDYDYAADLKVLEENVRRKIANDCRAQKIVKVIFRNYGEQNFNAQTFSDDGGRTNFTLAQGRRRRD